MYISQKFNLIDQIKQSNEHGVLIPDYLIIEQKTSQIEILSFLKKGQCILRSSIKHEGELSKLNSGRSLSYKKIQNLDEFNQKYTLITSQQGFDFCILQKEIAPLEHFTACKWTDTLFIESTSDYQKFLINSLKHKSGNLHFDKDSINKIFKALSYLLNKKNYLLEFGISDSKLFIFQINEINDETIEFTTNNFVKKFIRFQNQIKPKYTFFELLKIEFEAFKFRNKNYTEFGVLEIWLNWKYLFHYYYLYCLINKFEANQANWFNFLQNRNFFVRKHLNIAQNLSQKFNDLTTDHYIELTESSEVYIGSGVKKLNLKECIVIEEIQPDIVYLQSEKVFLIKKAHCLSHSVLALFELNCFAVLNITSENWTRLQNTQNVKIDFNKKIFIWE